MEEMEWVKKQTKNLNQASSLPFCKWNGSKSVKSVFLTIFNSLDTLIPLKVDLKHAVSGNIFNVRVFRVGDLESKCQKLGICLVEKLTHQFCQFKVTFLTKMLHVHSGLLWDEHSSSGLIRIHIASLLFQVFKHHVSCCAIS